MRSLCAALAVALLLPPIAPAVAQDEEPGIEFFYPVVTRRPVIERELEFRVQHEKGRQGQETEIAGAVELPLLPWWQIELEVPLAINDPREGNTEAGVGDLGLQNKLLLFKSVQYRTLLGGGFELALPSGSASRGLGGELAIEPFLTGGIALGPLDLLADLAYEWRLNRESPREQELTADLAVGYRVSRWLTPFLELNTVTKMRGADDEDGPKLLRRIQVYLTPGFNVRPLPGVTLRAGIQLPVTQAKTFDYTLHGAVVWEF